MSREEFLSKVPIFSRCAPEEIESIAAVAQDHWYQPDQIIVTQGTPGQAFYLILSGNVVIERDGERIGTFGPGDFFGEMSLLDSAPRSATIRSLDTTQCLMVASWDFRSLLERYPSIAVKLLEVLSKRLRDADAQLGARDR